MKKRVLTIIIGGDMERDERALFSNPEKASLEQPENALYMNSYEQLNTILSPARLDLLRYLIRNKRLRGLKSVGQIAKELNRKQEAISRDLHYLHGLNYVNLKKEKQTVYASTEFEDIAIQMQEA
ncbi:MAG: hypothetical protein AABX02_02475 [archaeon]